MGCNHGPPFHGDLKEVSVSPEKDNSKGKVRNASRFAPPRRVNREALQVPVGYLTGPGN
jgi:hypothetical protein